MKVTIVNAFQQYAAFNLGCVGSDLRHEFREIANCSSAESDYYSDEIGSLSGVKDPLSVAAHSIKELLRSTPHESSLAETLQAALIKCKQLQTELLEFLLPGQNTSNPCTTESLVDFGKTTGVKWKWIEVTARIDAIDEHAAEITGEDWRKAKQEIVEVIDGCLLGFPETLFRIEAQLPSELMPFTTLARRLSELREQARSDRKSVNTKIRGTYFRVLNTIEPELRALFDTCIRIQPALQSAIPHRIDDEKLEASLFEIRASIAKKLSEQGSLEVSTSIKKQATLEKGKRQQQMQELNPRGGDQSEGEVTLKTELTLKESQNGLRINGIEVKLASALEVGILKQLCLAKRQWANAEELSQVLGSDKASESSGIRKKLSTIRNAIREAFSFGRETNPIPVRSSNRKGEWRLDKALLAKHANELPGQKSEFSQKHEKR